MDDEFNGIKGELDINASFDQKKNVTKNKAKGDIVDNSTNQSANTIINGQIVQHNFQVMLSDQQLGNIVGIAKDQIVDSVKGELLKYPEEILKKAFHEVSPMYLATFASVDQSEIQVKTLVNENLDAAIKKQVIQTVGFLTKKDIKLLSIISSILDLLNKELFWLWDSNIENLHFRTTDGNRIKVTEELIKVGTEIKLTMIKSKINIFENKFGEINFNDFENLKRNGVILNDGSTHKPVDELICKTFFRNCNDTSKNEEYAAEVLLTRTRENRDKWTSWFNESKFKGTFVEQILNDMKYIISKMKPRSYWNGSNDDYKMFYSITKLGEEIVSSFKK